MLYQQKVLPIVVSFAIGIVLVYGHGVAAHFLWGARFGDPISMMASTGHPPKESPFWKHLISWPLHKFRYVGLLLVAGGVYGTVNWVYEHITGKSF